jgi:hypothetical protein
MSQFEDNDPVKLKKNHIAVHCYGKFGLVPALFLSSCRIPMTYNYLLQIFVTRKSARCKSVMGWSEAELE